MATRVLITGIAGFVGNNLARLLLDRGFDVLGIDDLSAGLLENVPVGAQFQQVDIRDASIYPLFQGVDTVFHFAAKNCLADCVADPQSTASINVGGTVNVLEASRRSGVRKFVFADTSAEYEGIHEMPLKVDTVRPLGPYAVSKRGAALFCESYASLHRMNVTVVRYFNVYGPWQDWRRTVPPLMSAFIFKLLRRERPTVFGTGNKRRDFIYIDDVNAFNFLAMSDPRADGRTFNVGSGVNHSVMEIFDLIERHLQTGLRPEFGPDMSWEAEVTLADISGSRELGWEPRVTIEDGIARSIAFIRNNVLARTVQPVTGDRS